MVMSWAVLLIGLIVLVGFVVPLIVLVAIVSSQAKKKRKQLEVSTDMSEQLGD